MTIKAVESVIDGALAMKDNSDRQVRVFRDFGGDISVATLDDISIEPEDDARVALITSIANEYEWEDTSDFPDCIEGYEGSLNALASSVLGRVFGTRSQ